MFGLSEEDLKLREVIEVDIAEEMFPEDENPDDPCTFQSKVHRQSTQLLNCPIYVHPAQTSCASILPLQVTSRGPLSPGWQKSALSCNYKLLTVRMAGPDIYPTR